MMWENTVIVSSSRKQTCFNSNRNHEQYDNECSLINLHVSLDTCEDIGLAVSTDKTKCMEVGHYRGMIAISIPQ